MMDLEVNVRVIRRDYKIDDNIEVTLSLVSIDKSKKQQDLAIGDMINWSLTSEVKLKGSNLIGSNLPNLVNVVMSNTKKGILHKDLLACNKYTMNDEIKKYKGHVTVIVGEKDIMTPKNGINSLKNFIPNLDIKILEKVGHFHMLEDHMNVNKIIETKLLKK